MLNNPDSSSVTQGIMNLLGIKSPDDAFSALRNLTSGDLNKLSENLNIMGLTPIEIQIFVDEIIKGLPLNQVCSARNMTQEQVLQASRSAKQKLEAKMMEKINGTALFKNLFGNGGQQ